MISNMVGEWNLGQMAPSMRVNIRMARRTEKENLLSLTVVIMTENLKVMKSVEEASITGLMGNFTKDSGRRIKCTDMVYYCGKTERSMKVNL